MEALKLRIKRRLEVYLELDIDGLRKFVINILLKLKKLTVDRLYQELNKKFKISHRAVASTLGYIHSKLGIIHAVKESYKTPIVYSLKEEYVNIINSVLHENTQITSVLYPKFGSSIFLVLTDIIRLFFQKRRINGYINLPYFRY